MDYENYLKITLNGFLLNSGVVGLQKLMDFAGATIENDYFYEGQCYYLSKEFVQKNDLADLYVKTMVDNFREQTQYSRIIGKKQMLLNLYQDYPTPDKNKEKEINGIYSELVKMLDKNSFKSGYEILTDNGISVPITNMINDFKKEKDLNIKKAMYLQLIEFLKNSEVEEVLMFKELMYSKINMFWESVAFFHNSNLKSNIKECYRKEFITPLNELIKFDGIGKKRCLDCNEMVNSTRPMSFVNDVIDDVNRKKSYYWNQKPDAFLCPLCAFIYTLIPLGFEYMGRDAAFINNNSDVESLIDMMSTFKQMGDIGEDTKSKKYKLYNIFTEQKIERLHEKVNNIQVVFRDKDTSKYNFNIISKRTIEIFDKCKKELVFLKNIPVKIKATKDKVEYLNIYELVVDNLIQNRNQYNLMSYLIRIQLNEDGRCGFIENILLIQIKSKGGNDVETNVKRVYAIKKYGEEMRNILAADVSEKDKDNKLRGFVYQLLNAVSSNNSEQFLNLIIRAYSSCGKAVPDIFLNCFTSEDTFKAIGYAYILGLKSEGFSKVGKDDNNDK